MSVYRFFLFCLIGLAISLSGCSEKEPSAGIEIGNPSIAFTASFIIDYGFQSDTNASSVILAKMPGDNETMVIDKFRLDLTHVRSYSSYYVYVTIDPAEGLLLWPYETMPTDTTLSVNFGNEIQTGESVIDDAFKQIDLQEEGLLKEIGVGFKPDDEDAYSIAGSLKINGEDVPFEYSLSSFKAIDLRYHYQQAEIYLDSLNLPVTFYVQRWISEIDFTLASIENDTVRFSETENATLWNTLNERFLSSFSCLRWSWTSKDGDTISDYVSEALAQFDKTSTNWAVNGDFSNGSTGWILMEQYSGVADSSIIHESKNEYQMKINVTKGGSKSYSVQLIHEDIPVLQNRKYKLIFTAWSNIEGPITVRLGSYHTPYNTLGFQEKPIIGLNGKSFEIEYLGSEDNTFARLEFNLGGAERIFWFKNIQLIRID